MKQYEEKSHQLRLSMLDMCINAGKGHVTSAFSCMDLLVALYQGGILRVDPTRPDWPERDRFLLSKGQASPAYYQVLADAGFFPKADLAGFAKLGGKMAVHLQNTVPGVEITAGSLGMGFGVAAGLALSAKLNRQNFMVFALLGDGELYEGSIWESAMFAAHNRLNNLVTIVDRNRMCTMDFTEDLLAIEPLADKWRAFGFDVKVIDGHDFSEIFGTLVPLRNRPGQRPTVVIAETLKGAGAESLCYEPMWHGRAPDKAMKEKLFSDLERWRAGS